MEKLTFEDIELYVDDLVGVLTGEKNELWFKRHWEILENAGLTKYSDDLQRTTVFMHAIILGVLWREFLYVLYDETNEICINQLTEKIPLSEIRLGQLVGSEFENDFFENEDNRDLSLKTKTLIELINENRPIIANALKRHYYDDSSFFQGFTDFRNDPKIGGVAAVDFEDSDDYSYEEEMGGGCKEKAFEWISEGCPNVSFLY